MLMYSVYAVMELENKSDQTYTRSTLHIQKETQREKKKEREKEGKKEKERVENDYVHFLACISR